MADNPWNVDSIEAFSFLKCPECIFDTKEEESFLEHAFEDHPLSSVFFDKILLKSEVGKENAGNKCDSDIKSENDNSSLNGDTETLTIGEHEVKEEPVGKSNF